MGPTLRLLALVSIIGCVELISVTTPQKNINVTMGQSVLLQCMFVTNVDTTGLTIQWDFVSSASMTPQQLYYYQSGKDVITKAYEGRLQPSSSPGMTKNTSIAISNMQPSDSGVYTCQIHNFPDVDGPSEANIIVNVLEKPTVPYCAVHGDVESGHLVTLTCHSERGSPNPAYIWTRLDHTQTRRRVLGLGGAPLRPRKNRIVFPWQPQPAASMPRKMSHKPEKKRPVENNWSNVTLLNNRMSSRSQIGDILYESDPIQKIVLEKLLYFVVAAHKRVPFGR
ncbi:hypothetical protein FQN60_001028, partial [Etheostoma spectabile]